MHWCHSSESIPNWLYILSATQSYFMFQALVELITVVLACAYVAQLNRRRRREDRGWDVDDRIGDAAENTHHGTML